MSETAAQIIRLLEAIHREFGSLPSVEDPDGRTILATQLALRGARIGETPVEAPTPPTPEPTEAQLVSVAWAPAEDNTGTLYATDLDGRLWSRYVGDGSGWQEEDRPKVKA